MSASASLRPASNALLAASLALVCGLAACSSPPPPAPPPVAQAPPPPPPVLLPHRVVESASIYEAYVQHAAAIDPGFSGGDAVAASLKTGETYEADQFQRGETAYGAIVALQDPTFVASLRAFATDAGRRSQVANAIMADPNYAATFKGSDSAAGLVIAALSDQGQKLLATGARIRQAAYDVQHQSWSKADVVGRDTRLALAKSLSAEQQQAIDEDALRLNQAATGAQPMGLAAPPAAPPYTPLVARSLAVAAMAALGEGGEEYSTQLNALLTDNVESSCLHMAKLNLYQCLAVSKPHYEDVFCLGQHAVSDTGQCIMRGAQIAVAPPAPPSVPAAEVKTVSTKKAPVHHKKKPAATATNAG
jgi:hypothetical protein